jgi:hypothetical protein
MHSPAAGKRARSRGLALAVLAALALTLGACGDASPSGGSPSGSAGPATAKLTLAGDSGVSGTAKVIAVRCFEPSFDGEAIAVAAQAPGGQLFLAVSLRPGTISVRLSAGQGASFVERDFKGTGVTGFDAAHGAGISSQLSDSTPAGARSTGVGALTSISGSVDCAGQQPGNSALTVTGDSAAGHIGGPLTSARVECDTSAQGNRAFVQGLTQAGSTPVELIITIGSDALSAFQIVKDSSATSSYTGKAAGIGTPTTSGGRASGDVVEAVSGSASAHKLHISGDVTCGSTVAL